MQTTDQFFAVAATDHWYAQLIRDHIVPNLASFLWRFDATKEFLFPTISQIGIDYREHSLSRHVGNSQFDIKAGDRMPYFRVNGENVYDRLRAPKFHLLIVTDGARDFSPLRAQIAATYAPWVDVHILPLYPRVVDLFGARQSFWTLLRPDNHLAFISAHLAPDALHDYIRALRGSI